MKKRVIIFPVILLFSIFFVTLVSSGAYPCDFDGDGWTNEDEKCAEVLPRDSQSGSWEWCDYDFYNEDFDWPDKIIEKCYDCHCWGGHDDECSPYYPGCWIGICDPDEASACDKDVDGCCEGVCYNPDDFDCIEGKVAIKCESPTIRRKKPIKTLPVMQKDPENLGKFIWTSGDCLISDEYECVECVVDGDCDFGENCCGGACYDRSTHSCCGLTGEDGADCRSSKVNSKVDVVMESGCYNAVPEKYTHALPTEETPPEGMVATQYSDSEITIYDNVLAATAVELGDLKEQVESGQIIPQIDDVTTTLNTNPPFVTFDALTPQDFNFVITKNVDGVSARFIGRWENSNLLYRVGWQTDTKKIVTTEWTSEEVWSVTGDGSNEGQGEGSGKPTGSWLTIMNQGPEQFSSARVTFPTFGVATDELNWFGKPHVLWADIIANPANPGFEFGVSGQLNEYTFYYAKGFANPYTKNVGGVLGMGISIPKEIELFRPSTWQNPLKWGNNNEDED
jgi:hypothetical protein